VKTNFFVGNQSIDYYFDKINNHVKNIISEQKNNFSNLIRITLIHSNFNIFDCNKAYFVNDSIENICIRCTSIDHLDILLLEKDLGSYLSNLKEFDSTKKLFKNTEYSTNIHWYPANSKIPIARMDYHNDKPYDISLIHQNSFGLVIDEDDTMFNKGLIAFESKKRHQVKYCELERFSISTFFKYVE
jgi:hypothetical protein